MKPTVFNYSDYERVVEENKKLKAEVANLLIRCRIAESDKPKWIPVSERLPEDTSKPVLISGIYKRLGVYAVDIARYNGGMWQYDGFTFPDCDILAWMPLPEPYREDGEEE